MKHLRFHIIITCFCFALFNTGCEKAEIQSISNAMGEKILPRGECEECPGIDICCCGVWLLEPDDDADIYFCGTTATGPTCFGSDICGEHAVSGGYWPTFLDGNEPRAHFCIAEGAPFYIHNQDPNDVANIVITCQTDLTNPDTIQLHIQPGERLYFETNASCELAPCD